MDDRIEPDSPAASSPSTRNRTVVLTVAASCLAGTLGGLAAFGIANAVTTDDPASTARSGADAPTSSMVQPSRQAVAPTPTAVPSIVPSTSPDATTSSSAPSTSSTAADQPRLATSQAPTTRAVGADDEGGPVLPERVLPTLTTTRQRDENRDGADVRQAGVEEATTPTTSPRPTGEDEDKDTDAETEAESEESTSRPSAETGGDRRRDDDGRESRRRDPTETGPVPISDRAPFTVARVDGAFRNALAPGVPADRRDILFEQGAASRPLTDRLMALSTGSAPLLQWSLHDPVVVEGDRATAQLRSDAFLSTNYQPVTFVLRDGQWKLSAESTCVLSRNLLLPCAP